MYLWRAYYVPGTVLEAETGGDFPYLYSGGNFICLAGGHGDTEMAQVITWSCYYCSYCHSKWDKCWFLTQRDIANGSIKTYLEKEFYKQAVHLRLH